MSTSLVQFPVVSLHYLPAFSSGFVVFGNFQHIVVKLRYLFLSFLIVECRNVVLRFPDIPSTFVN